MYENSEDFSSTVVSERALSSMRNTIRRTLEFDLRARHLREVSGSTDLESTARKMSKVLHHHQIPHYVTGGYAVQHHGYPRFTSDVDIIVPDVQNAREKLAMNGFKMNQGSNMTVTDRESKVEVTVLPGGGRVGPGPLSLPMPTTVSKYPNYLPLEDLVSQKLSSHAGSPTNRHQDKSDVIGLMKANSLPRNFSVHPDVQSHYQQTWDDLNDLPGSDPSIFKQEPWLPGHTWDPITKKLVKNT